MTHQTKKVLSKDISPIVVAKYYLEIELFKLFSKKGAEIKDSIVSTIEELPDSKVWALLEAISFTYHLNGVFYNVSRENYIWNEEIWSIESLIMTDMGPKTNKIIYSEEVNQDPIKFRNYLQKYFEQHREDDPEGLAKYKPTNKKINFDKLILKEKDGKISMLDGSHRLIEMLLSGKKEVSAYVGYPNSKEAEEHPKTRVGKSIFILLTILFKNGDAVQKQAVLSVLKQLVKNYSDGQENAIKYWIESQADSEIKEAGQQILV